MSCRLLSTCLGFLNLDTPGLQRIWRGDFPKCASSNPPIPATFRNAVAPWNSCHLSHLCQAWAWEFVMASWSLHSESHLACLNSVVNFFHSSCDKSWKQHGIARMQPASTDPRTGSQVRLKIRFCCRRQKQCLYLQDSPKSRAWLWVCFPVCGALTFL